MGSLLPFQSPSPYQQPTVTYRAPTTATPVSKVTPETQTQNETPISEGEPNDIEAVRNAIRKTTRGRNSTIQTSYRGVLDESGAETQSLIPQRKSLLGE